MGTGLKPYCASWFCSLDSSFHKLDYLLNRILNLVCVSDLLIFIHHLLLDDGKQRLTLHSLFLLQLEELLTQHILVSLSQSRR